jgi:hypothetical protein
MNFSAILNLADLTPAEGVVISGLANGDTLGFSVAGAGDLNNDGYADFVVGAPGADPNGDRSGTAYVVFGTASGLPGAIDLGALDGTNGFRLHGTGFNAGVGYSAAAVGDFNGDGIGDLVVGSPGYDGNDGVAYLLFGKDTAVSGGFAADLNLSSLDGTDGFRFGIGAYDLTGQTVRSGDVNGDGLADLIVSAPTGDTAVFNGGSVYVIFGDTDGMPASLAPGDLDGANGFRLLGTLTGAEAGSALGVADVNSDGFDDILITAPRADGGAVARYQGYTYVVYGAGGGFAASSGLEALVSAGQATRIEGALASDFSGQSVASAGDVNGDGFEDLIIGAIYSPGSNSEGGAFVVFGKPGSLGATFSLADLDGSNGFQVPGTTTQYSFAGRSVSSAGDIDGDGYGDLIIGAPATVLNGRGEAYVIYGKSTFDAVIDPALLDGRDGFRIQGVFAGSATGRAVGAAGDINGDGFDDLIVGAPATNSPGFAYVIYGRARDELVVGGAGDDVQTGHWGKDSLSGMDGDDVLDGGANNDLLMGGDGADDLTGGLGGDSLFGEADADQLSGGDGADKLYGGGGADLLDGDAGNDRMAGEGDADTLNGGAGNDYLDGGLGADVMTGGTDNDIYIVDDASDQTIELANEGYDIVRTTLHGWVLAANLEGLELQGSGHLDGTGNSEANNIQGNSWDNTLSGLAGNDTLNGNDGDDTIVGGLGGDLLRGGAGADTFVVGHAFVAVLETDIVYDFSAAGGDILDLSGAYGGALTIVSSFSKTAGEMTVSFASGQTTVKLDINGDGKAEYQMRINGDVTGETGDWLL